MMNKIAYEAIMNNAQKTKTGRRNAVIPVELLKVDPLYQRVEGRNERKLNKLKGEWDYNLMDALLVVPHPETGDFYVVDGLGRLTVAKEIGLTELDCVIVPGPKNIKERRKFEAGYFLRQADCTDYIKPVLKHNALVLRGDETACVIEKICKAYKVKIVPKRGKRTAGTLGSYASAYRMLEKDTDRESNLRWVFDAIKFAGYDKDLNGYSAALTEALYSIHKAYGAVTSKAIGEYIRPMSHTTLKARAIAKYPERTGNSGKLAIVLFLQDYIVETYNQRAVFDASGKKVVYTITAA